MNKISKEAAEKIKDVARKKFAEVGISQCMELFQVIDSMTEPEPAPEPARKPQKVKVGQWMQSKKDKYSECCTGISWSSINKAWEYYYVNGWFNEDEFDPVHVIPAGKIGIGMPVVVTEDEYMGQTGLVDEIRLGRAWVTFPGMNPQKGHWFSLQHLRPADELPDWYGRER